MKQLIAALTLAPLLAIYSSSFAQESETLDSRVQAFLAMTCKIH